MIEYTVKVYDNGTKFWYLNDKLHREDGPACEYANGDKFWYLNDNELSFDNWLDATTALCDEEKILMKLKYG